MLVLSSQARLLGSNPVVWLCDQEPVRTFQKGLPPEKAKLRRWWTYLSPLRLTVHHIQRVKNECADYISRNNFDDLIGARSEALAKEAFSRMDVHLDLNMTMIRPLDGLQQAEYLKEFGDIYKRLEKRLEPLLVNQEQWKRDKSYLWHGDQIVVASDKVPALLKWTHESSGHVGADRTWGYSSSGSTLRGVTTNCVRPSSLSWTSACVGPANQGISGTGVSTRPCPSATVLTVCSMWTTRRCRSLGATILPSWNVWLDQVYPGVPVYQAHYRRDTQDTPGGVVLCLWGAQRDDLR